MSKKDLTLDILICTIDDGIMKVPQMLLPERDDVRYTVSVQQTNPESPVTVPDLLKTRQDVTLAYMEGAGLSRNRNNSLHSAIGDICLIADDDNRYTSEHLDTILKAWHNNPDADIITFQAEDYDGYPLHPYPAPYICSVEITFRRSSILDSGISFDERFGLGSELLCAGEEDVFLADARRKGLTIRYIPQVIVRTNRTTTSSGFENNKKLQLTKGATFRYVYGTGSAVWRSFKEAGWYLIHKRANPFPILFNMIKGIWILR